MSRSQVERYLSDLAVAPPEREHLSAPDDALRACVIIPAYREHATIGETLDALEGASNTGAAFEVIVVVNNSTDASAEAIEENRRTVDELSELERSYPLHVLDRASPDKAFAPDEAGVGRARRVAMDLALARLHRVGRGADGLIACLDADSPCAPGYIDQLLAEFERRPKLLAGICHYRHPLPSDPNHARAMAAYESWLRYFETGLRLARSPYAFQSLGSCMVLTGEGYALADGSPTRQALNDFYLLQKVVKAGGRDAIAQLETPLVVPSARATVRVKRGTGASLHEFLDGEAHRYAYPTPAQAFFDLDRLFAAVTASFREPKALEDAASPQLSELFDMWNGWKTFEKLRSNSSDAAHFQRAFHTWFDSLKTVKFTNRVRESSTEDENGGILRQTRRLLQRARERGRWKEFKSCSIPSVSPRQASLEDWRRLLDVLRRLNRVCFTQ